MRFFKLTIPAWGFCLLLPSAIFLGVVLERPVRVAQQRLDQSKELREHKGHFTSPLLECEVFEDQGFKILKPFKYRVEELLQQRMEQGVLIDGSVYFRDLNNGMWFGINESVGYRPSSMLKIPVMIAYYKLAESDPRLLATPLVYRGGEDLTRMQGVRPADTLMPGRAYTIDDLIERMIVVSDNNAAQMLVEYIDKYRLEAVLKDLDVNVNVTDYEHMVTTHAYSGFLRVLYNASYLNRQFSEKALNLLSRTRFTEGIRAGVPPTVTVAAKFGEWGDSGDSEIVQSHEFAIVYYPGRPYLLGIMSRGKRGQEFNNLLREISKLIFDSVDQQHRPALREN